jgi:hypothetical protein
MSIENVTYAFQVAATTGAGLTVGRADIRPSYCAPAFSRTVSGGRPASFAKSAARRIAVSVRVKLLQLYERSFGVGPLASIAIAI